MIQAEIQMTRQNGMEMTEAKDVWGVYVRFLMEEEW